MSLKAATVVAGVAVAVAGVVPTLGHAGSPAVSVSAGVKPAVSGQVLTHAQALAQGYACGLSVSQPGGPYTEAWITWNNCWPDAHSLGQSPVFAGRSGNTYTYASSCLYIAPGDSATWDFKATDFPPEPATVTGVTYCD